MGNDLTGMGIVKGDRVTLFLPNVPEFFFCYFGILKARSVVNPVKAILKQSKIDYIIGDCAPKAIVTAKALAAEPLNVFRKVGSNIKQMIVIGGDGETDIIHFEG
ncbi:MAG: AMP-binding protein [Desulfobacteraceae bacterium]|nr:MAG: AMP-binding protein [Desulfobacteraceae bacterium]